MPTQFLRNFHLTPVSGRIASAVSANPLGPLALLPGTWKGTGFNQIWRPFPGAGRGQPRFLELNETIETLEFTEVPGEIVNRGLLQPDITFRVVIYDQTIQDANVLGPNGAPIVIHFERGDWRVVPATTNPSNPATVVRQASILHGVTFPAQGAAIVTLGPPTFKTADITPFEAGNPGNPARFPEQVLANASQFRTALGDIPNIVQADLDDPNSLLSRGIAGKDITETTTLIVSSEPLNPPSSGGGIGNIAFLVGTTGPIPGAPPDPNAAVVRVDAIFWIERIINHPDGRGAFQLQYSQRVLLRFNGLDWPHVSVATLQKI